MSEKKILAEKGTIIGVTGFDRLCCSKCGEPLEWAESDGPVKINQDTGALEPAYEDKLDIGKATTKEAVCCDRIYTAVPQPFFVISFKVDKELLES